MWGIVRRTVWGFALGLLIAPSAASAGTPGVHVDPNSPSGKEYAIPLEQTRNGSSPGATSGGSGGGGGSSSSGAPLFGSGVGPPGGGSSHGGGGGGAGTGAGGSGANGSGRGGSHAGRGGGSGVTGAVGGSAVSHPPGGLDLAAANPKSGGKTPLLVGGLAAVVLLAGFLPGLILRRRRRTS